MVMCFKYLDEQSLKEFFAKILLKSTEQLKMSYL